MTVATPTTAKPGSLLSEQLHYAVIRTLAGNEFNAIKYLYDRLNIIDAKASTLLRFNALFVTAMVFVLGGLRAIDTPALRTPVEEGLFWGGFILLTASTVFTFLMFGLQFDNVTVLSRELHRRLVPKCDANCRDHDPETCTISKECELRRLCNELDVNSPNLPIRRLEDYEEEFFKITIDRQKWLNGALILTKCAGGYFVFLISVVAWNLGAGSALLYTILR